MPHALDTTHPGDADLLRVLDGATDAMERADAVAHAATCTSCAARTRALQARRARLAALLAEVDAPVPVLAPPSATPSIIVGSTARGAPAWRMGPALRAASLLLLAAGATLAAQPSIRQWMSTEWSRLTSDDAVRAPVAPTAAAPGAAAGTSVVAFTPAPGPFAVRFDARQAGGTLVIVADGGTQARAARTGDDGGEIVVLPSAFIVRNAATSTASYRVTVPLALREVRVRVGDGAEVTVPLAPGATREIPLSTTPGSDQLI